MNVPYEAADGGAPAQADPYLWLEDVTGAKPLEWARARNAESAKALATGEFEALQQRILEILNSDARIPSVEKCGHWYYNFWKDATNPRGIWRRTLPAEYRKAHPTWEIVLDLDALCAAESENWVWQGAEWLKSGFRRCLVSISRGGADACVVREFDLETKTFVEDGFALPEAKTSASWIDIDSLFVATDFGAGSMTASGYPRMVKVWRRGTPLAQAEAVFEGKPADIWIYAVHDQTKGYERDLIRRGVEFYTNELLLLREGALIKVNKPDSATAVVHRDLLLLELRDDWSVGGRTYLAGSLLAADFESFMGGTRDFEVLSAPTERKSIVAFSPTLNHILVNELDNVGSRVYMSTRKDGKWIRAALPGVPEFGAVTVGAVDDADSDDYFMTVTGYLTPTSLFFGTAGGSAPEQLKQLPAFFDAVGLTVSQHETVSNDGTKIPYFQVARTDVVRDGKQPTLLYGYGGFEIAMVPGYSGGVGAGWLEKGGVYVVANIRGGGEFGPRWHKAALKANRPKAYEDFIAVAEDLVRRKLTSPAHLGIQGGSNGGLLMGNMLTMRPDLFGAVVCQCPLLDMRRYHTLLAGASWMAEYGNPDDPDEWAFIRMFSPYHNLNDRAKYPPTLFMTSTRDDRVHPGHARKMAARMLEVRHDVLYYENTEGGHAGAADNSQQARMNALAYTFLWQRLR